MIEVSLLYFTMNLKGDCMAARRPKAIVHRRLNCLILNWKHFKHAGVWNPPACWGLTIINPYWVQTRTHDCGYVNYCFKCCTSPMLQTNANTIPVVCTNGACMAHVHAFITPRGSVSLTYFLLLTKRHQTAAVFMSASQSVEFAAALVTRRMSAAQICTPRRWNSLELFRL